MRGHVVQRGSKWVARLKVGRGDFVVGVCGSEAGARQCLARHEAAVADGTSPFLLPDVLSLKLYAASIGVRYGTVKRWVHEGMPVHKVDHAVLVVPKEAEAWVAKHRRGGVCFARRAVIYFAQRDADMAIKIGWSSNIARRLGELASKGRVEVALLAAVPGNKPDEQALHARFAEDLIADEWFRPSAALMGFIASLGRIAA